jgi:hypothetical protein
LVNLKLKVPPWALIGLAVPESKLFPSSLVTVWGAPVIFVHVTVVPTEMVSVAGLKVKEPLLSVVMVTIVALPEVVVVAVGVVLLPLP